MKGKKVRKPQSVKKKNNKNKNKKEEKKSDAATARKILCYATVSCNRYVSTSVGGLGRKLAWISIVHNLPFYAKHHIILSNCLN